MRILLATDGSGYSKASVNELARLSFTSNSEVLIISAFRSSSLIMSGPAPMGGLAGNFEEADLIARTSAEGFVQEAANLLQYKSQGLKITTKVINDSPKIAILDEAKSFDADLIVVGSQGHGAFSRFLLGSVSQSIAMHAHCSVMIVRKKHHNTRK